MANMIVSLLVLTLFLRIRIIASFIFGFTIVACESLVKFFVLWLHTTLTSLYVILSVIVIMNALLICKLR